MSESDTPRTDELDDRLVDLSPNTETDYSLMKAHARKLERELNAARIEVEAANDLAETWKTWERETGVKRDTAVKLYLETVKQRDRLVEALKEIDCNKHGRNSGFECRAIASKALQSLTTNDKVEARQSRL